MHLQIVLSSEEKSEANKSYEAYAHMYKVKVRHYHADNDYREVPQKDGISKFLKQL